MYIHIALGNYTVTGKTEFNSQFNLLKLVVANFIAHTETFHNFVNKLRYHNIPEPQLPGMA